MKRIQTLLDIEVLKSRESLPSGYISVIETQFIEWFEADGENDSLDIFELPNHACIYHLEESDMKLIMDQITDVEFVETEEVEGWTYFRVGLMQDHQIGLQQTIFP